MTSNFIPNKQLKSDAFGSIEQGIFITELGISIPAIKRNYSKNKFFRPLALYLATKEKKALEILAKANHPSLPKLLKLSKHYHIRSFIPGESMHRCPDKLSPEYFKRSKQLLTTMRRFGIANNDLAKEANWLITEDGMPAVTDFQLALSFKKNSKLLRIFAHEDLRHLLKHKRKYLSVTAKEIQILNNKTLMSKVYKNTFKRMYLLITRKILRWQDRVGPEERHI
ncbi:MAG: hypothetical protein H0U57_10720 [Tatlockia sp.]|nr:hypothetical protein [Tatlockia sp.]